MKLLRWLFGRRKPEVLHPEPLSHDGRAWQRNEYPRFKHFAQ